MEPHAALPKKCMQSMRFLLRSLHSSPTNFVKVDDDGVKKLYRVDVTALSEMKEKGTRFWQEGEVSPSLVFWSSVPPYPQIPFFTFEPGPPFRL